MFRLETLGPTLNNPSKYYLKTENPDYPKQEDLKSKTQSTLDPKP